MLLFVVVDTCDDEEVEAGEEDDDDDDEVLGFSDTFVVVDTSGPCVGVEADDRVDGDDEGVG